MPDLQSQREIASRVLRCGKSRVWFDPSRIEDIEEAITAEDVRRLVRDGVIRKIPAKGNSGFRINFARMQKQKGRRKGKGSMKGKLGTRIAKKTAWIKRIRTIRKVLKELRDSKRIDKKMHRKVYMVSKSGYLRSRAHLMTYLERNNMLKDGKESKTEIKTTKAAKGKIASDK